MSIVLLGEVGGKRFLLTGDVEDDVDPVLAARGIPAVDFLKVAHHGSGTASTIAFLDVVRPALAVVSAGADNPYGHPARSTLDHLTDAGARVFRTDTDGSVEVSFEGDRMSVRTTGARPVAAAATQSHPRRIGRSGRRCVGLQLRGTIERMTQTPASPATARAPIAYFWGDDDLGSSRAIGRMAEAIGARNGGPVERFEVRGDRNQAAAQIADLHQRVATQSMFGGGSLAVVTNAGALTVRNEDRDALVAVLPLVAPGSGVVFVEASPSGARQPGLKRLVDAVQQAGGEIRAFRAPKAGELAGWIEAEARERGLRLGQGASRAMATRVGGFVTDNDADRRNQTMIVDRELDKLALYRPDGEIKADDVEALVAEAVPGSVWAFTDAVGRRDLARASELLDRLAATTPEPVLLAVLHRRIRELVEVADRLASGEKEASLPRSMGIHSFRAEQLALQARRWTLPELEAALEALVDLDATVKGAPGYGASEAQRRLAFTTWLAENVVPRAT